MSILYNFRLSLFCLQFLYSDFPPRCKARILHLVSDKLTRSFKIPEIKIFSEFAMLCSFLFRMQGNVQEFGNFKTGLNYNLSVDFW